MYFEILSSDIHSKEIQNKEDTKLTDEDSNVVPVQNSKSSIVNNKYSL